jgi:hypothetical protein
LRKFGGHTAKFGCDYCLARATYYHNKAGTGGKIAWPFTKDDNIPRTHEGTKTHSANLKHKGTPAEIREHNQGVKGTSELFKLEGFNVILDIPMEGMHMAFEGVAGMLLK